MNYLFDIDRVVAAIHHYDPRHTFDAQLGLLQ